MTLFLHVARRALAAFLGSLVAVVLLYLVVDFAENVSLFTVPGWLGAAAALYANRAAVVVYQTAPAAMLLGAAITASDLRRTREYTALRSLGLGPWRVATPAIAVGALVAVALGWMGDAVVVRATARADEILATRFHRGGALQRDHERKRWFRGRGGHRIYHLRGGGPAEGGFEHVTVLEVTPAFGLARRIDAERMTPGAAPGEWVLADVAERTFRPDGGMEAVFVPRRTYRFEEDPGAFDVRPGRPGQMTRAVLGEQLALRRRLGLSSRDFAIEWQDRLSYPLAALPGALLAVAVALRRRRKGHLTAALLEAVAISLAFWAVQAICWSLAVSGQLAPAVAAWTPDVLLAVSGLFALRRYA